MNKEFEDFKEQLDDNITSCDIDMGFSPRSAAELAEQKALLVSVMSATGEAGGLLEGILNMLDVTQDQLVDYHGFDTSVVFPFSHKFKDYVPGVINYREALQALLKNLPKEELPKHINSNPELTKVLNLFFKGEDI